MVKISLQNSGGKVLFLGEFHGTPLEHQQELKYLGHLSVKCPVCPDWIFVARSFPIDLPWFRAFPLECVGIMRHDFIL